MARKRLISPDFFKHADLFDAEDRCGLPLRLAFAGLWCQADKRGVFRWRPRELKVDIMPYDSVDFAKVLDALEDAGFVQRYAVDGRNYGFIPSFGRWQTFHRLEGPSADPAPPDEITGGQDLLNGRQPRAWIARDVRSFVMERDGHRCVRCGSVENLTMDHVVPYANGGSNEAENLQVLCRACNSRKGARIDDATGAQRPATAMQQPAMTATTPVTVAVTGAVAGTVVTHPSGESAVADATPAPVLVLDPEQPRPARRKAVPRPAPSWPHFPVALCQDMHALWISRFGAVEYPRFRKAFGPLFTIAEADRPSDAPTNAELREALKSYADLAPMGNAARFANVANAAACLAAIARTRRDLADAPDRRSDAVMRIIHGRAPQGAA